MVVLYFVWKNGSWLKKLENDGSRKKNLEEKAGTCKTS